MEVLYPYLENDLEITDGLYQSLSGLFSKSGIRNLRGLVNLHMQDLRVLQEMETNGIRLNWKAMQQRAAQTEEELNAIDKEILGWVPDVFRGAFNTRSNDHVSLLLYGGTHEQQVPEPYQHTYIGGPKAGTTETRNRWSPIRVEFPRLVDPLPKTALAKRDSEGNEAFWSTGADVLKELPGPKGLLSLLLKQSERSKLLTTYYHGFPAIAAKMDWQDGYLHGQFNQCNVITGRLSSSRPNQQNMPEVMNEFIQSRFS
jgi:DNA polymerase I-like protein with 3'-5' exonuclease and polymerase domains